MDSTLTDEQLARSWRSSSPLVVLSMNPSFPFCSIFTSAKLPHVLLASCSILSALTWSSCCFSAISPSSWSCWWLTLSSGSDPMSTTCSTSCSYKVNFSAILLRGWRYFSERIEAVREADVIAPWPPIPSPCPCSLLSRLLTRSCTVCVRLGIDLTNRYSLNTSSRPALGLFILAITTSRSGTAFRAPSLISLRCTVDPKNASTTSSLALISSLSSSGCLSQRSSRREPSLVRQRLRMP
mmetsp:Transcript_4157/g.9119  ORF Transcript_4157/g.9119 Transcript_4157/m.9119 type:complete len:239 (-) Transcript_4157:647-1363(-)